jgi:hypothetical protein
MPLRREEEATTPMSAFQTSTHACPVCKQPLFKLPAAAGRVLLWCGYGPCQSAAANDGASGLTEQEAFEQLQTYIINDRPKQEHDDGND